MRATAFVQFNMILPSAVHPFPTSTSPSRGALITRGQYCFIVKNKQTKNPKEYKALTQAWKAEGARKHVRAWEQVSLGDPCTAVSPAESVGGPHPDLPDHGQGTRAQRGQGRQTEEVPAREVHDDIRNKGHEGLSPDECPGIAQPLPGPRTPSHSICTVSLQSRGSCHCPH